MKLNISEWLKKSKIREHIAEVASSSQEKKLMEEFLEDDDDKGDN